MIELIYSQQHTDFAKGKAYSNPRFFSTPRNDVSKVFLVGDWPKIEEAYKALGVPVERLDPVKAVATPETVKAPVDVAEAIAEAFPDERTDEELRAFITERDGKAPHHKLGREKLLALAAVPLSRREIEADLSAMRVDFDPEDSDAALMAIRNVFREER